MTTDRSTVLDAGVWGTHAKDLADSDSLTVSPGDVQEHGVRVENIAHTGAVDVVHVASGASGEASVTLDSLSGESVSQGNDILVSSESGTELRVTNTSGGAIDVILTGYEVSR